MHRAFSKIESSRNSMLSNLTKHTCLVCKESINAKTDQAPGKDNSLAIDKRTYPKVHRLRLPSFLYSLQSFSVIFSSKNKTGLKYALSSSITAGRLDPCSFFISHDVRIFTVQITVSRYHHENKTIKDRFHHMKN